MPHVTSGESFKFRDEPRDRVRVGADGVFPARFAGLGRLEGSAESNLSGHVEKLAIEEGEYSQLHPDGATEVPEARGTHEMLMELARRRSE